MVKRTAECRHPLMAQAPSLSLEAVAAGYLTALEEVSVSSGSRSRFHGTRWLIRSSLAPAPTKFRPSVFSLQLFKGRQE